MDSISWVFRRGLCRGAALVALAFLVGGMLPTSATARPDRECNQTCKSDIKQCKRAAIQAKRVCREACPKGDRACHSVCKDAAHTNLRTCRQDQQLCGLACRPELDQNCAGVCVDDASTCTDGIEACKPACQARYRFDVSLCGRTDIRNQTGLRPVFDTPRECVEFANATFHECIDACPRKGECARNLRDCANSCEAAPLD